MSKKGKFGMALGALAMILVVAAASVGITIAAINAQVGSNFNISYVAHNVEAVVKGSYANHNGTQEASLGADLVFSSSDVNANKSFPSSPTIALDDENDWIEFHYTIENKGDFGFGVSLEIENLNNSNFNISYSKKYRSDADTQATYSYSSEFFDGYVAPSGSAFCIMDIGIKFQIVNEIQSSNATGNFKFNLDALAESQTILPTADDLKAQLLTTDTNLNSITFDKYTSENTYLVDGKNILEGAEAIDLHETSDTSSAPVAGVKLYKVTNDTKFDLYLLSDGKIFLNGSAASLFESCTATKLDLSNFDTSRVTNMESMFSGCSNLVQLNVKSFDTSRVTNMESMFSGCSSLVTLDLTSFDLSSIRQTAGGAGGTTAAATNGAFRLRFMFRNCSSLTEIRVSSALWKYPGETSASITRNKRLTSGVFAGCTSMPGFQSSHITLEYDTEYLTFV